jgi:SP family arabinose:H+ symporter-like MFS transporter
MKNKFPPALVRGALTGAASGLLFGFDTAVIAGSTALLTQEFHLSHRALGFTVSIAIWGTVIGSLGAGKLAQRCGGRFSLRILAVFYMVSSLGCALAPGWRWLLFARFVGGLGIGGSSVVGPVYVAELAPADWRGRMVGMFQINVVLGVLLAYLSNFLLERAGLPFALWRWQLGVSIVPAAALLLLLTHIPESPRWLVTQRRQAEALHALVELGAGDPMVKLTSIERGFVGEQEQPRIPLFSRSLLRPLLLAGALGALNQLSGINAILYYLNDVFTAGGYSRLTASSLTVTVGLMNLVATIGAISIIDKVGRLPLLLIGSIGTAGALGSIAWMFYLREHFAALVWLLAAYMIFFAISQGAVIWVYISEIFPNAARARGQSVGTTTHWVMNALIAGAFPVLAVTGMWLPFGFFSVMMFFQLAIVWKFMPETRGLTLEQVTDLMQSTRVKRSVGEGDKETLA